MPPPEDDDRPLAPAEAERLHRYFAAFLSPGAADEAIREVERAAAQGLTGEALLRAARRQLVERISVPRDLEIAVLIEDVGVPPDQVAAVANVPRATVDALIESEGLRPPAEDDVPGSGGRAAAPVRTSEVAVPDAVALADGTDGRGSAGPAGRSAVGGGAEAAGRPRSERSGLVGLVRSHPLGTVLVALGVALAVATVVVLVQPGDRSPEVACVATDERPVCVGEVRITDVVDRSGSPGAPRTRFARGETVKLWFSFAILDPSRTYVLDHVWTREGQVLYTSDFQLPPGGQVNLTLAQPFATEPGNYAVRVRRGDEVLVERSFTIE